MQEQNNPQNAWSLSRNFSLKDNLQRNNIPYNYNKISLISM